MSKQTAEDIAQAKELAILSAESLYNYKLIARSVGRDEDTLAIWRNEDEDFSDRLEIARTEFIKKHMKKARPDFLLERLEKEIFAQKVEVDPGTNAIKALLEAYGVTEGGDHATKTDGTIQESSSSQT